MSLVYVSIKLENPSGLYQGKFFWGKFFSDVEKITLAVAGAKKKLKNNIVLL